MSTTDQLASALADRYAIERLIGEGGMATVYLARDLRHNRRVALKVLRPDLGAVLGVDRFLSEIEVTANLQHPNLLPLFDSGAAGELLFYVMPYVQGESLRARIEREKQLPVEEAVRIATAIANALDYAHRQGVIHRDLKPENILLQEGQPLVADFGIALAVSKAGGARVTQTGLSLGTPQYMSPEQATGDRVIDARTDIYSLGAVTYEMLTGEPPHVGTTAQAIIARLLTERPRSARASRPAITEQVEGALERALEKLPADRWATAHEFAEALAGARPVTRAATGIAAGGSASADMPRRRVATRELVAWGAVGILALVTGWLTSQRESEEPASPLEFELTRPESISLSGGSANRLAISPDGRTVVFQGITSSGKRMLFSRSMADRIVRPILGSDDATAVVISPDGKEVLYPTTNGVTSPIQRLPLSGGVPRLFTPAGTSNGQLSWGDDGRVVFAQDYGIWVKGVDEGRAELLIKADSARGHVRFGFPEWLPGQRKALIAIWKGSAGLESVMLGVLSLEDRSVTELNIKGFAPRFSRTGHLLYMTTDGSLSAVPFDAATAQATGSSHVVQQGVAFGGGAAAAYAVSREGTLVMEETGQGSLNDIVTLVAVSRDGKRRNLGIPAGEFSKPRLSPDGRQVVFAAGSGISSTSDIWRAELSPPTLSRVTTTGKSDRPQFARDGRSIFFSAFPASEELYEVGLEAGAVPRLRARWGGPLVTGDVGPAEGHTVFGVVHSGGTDLWIAPMAAMEKSRPFAAEPYTEMLPRVSPDGGFVAFTSSRTGSNEVYVRQLPEGGDELRVSATGGLDPVWGMNGRELFYRSIDSMFVAELAFRPRPTVTRRHALFAFGVSYNSGSTSNLYDVFPNGREFVMFERVRGALGERSPIVVRLNWTRALEK